MHRRVCTSRSQEGRFRAEILRKDHEREDNLKMVAQNNLFKDILVSEERVENKR